MKKLIPIIILFFAVFVFAQEKAKAILVDEFGQTSCEEIWVRLDNFLIQLNENPGAIGTAEISGKIGDAHKDLYFESQINMYFLRRKIPRERWSIVRTRPGTERSFRFWLTPTGGDLPKINAAEWSLQYTKETKPFVFGWGESYAEDVCLTADELGNLAQILKANPNARTNVVLVVRSQREYDRRRREVMKQLSEDYSIRVL